MLLGLDPLLSPTLLQHLCAMGHGDDVAIVDANFPSASTARRLVRLDGADAVEATAAVLSVLPLDTFVDDAAVRMAVVDHPDEVPPVCAAFQEQLSAATQSRMSLQAVDRFSFYERAAAAYLVVATAERRLYGNLILKKGVIGDDGQTVYR